MRTAYQFRNVPKIVISLSTNRMGKLSCSRDHNKVRLYDIKLFERYHLLRALTSLMIGHVSFYTQLLDNGSPSAPAGNTVMNPADDT
jgi:hypothetical protein